jgi:hypothetical protein
MLPPQNAYNVFWKKQHVRVCTCIHTRVRVYMSIDIVKYNYSKKTQIHLCKYLITVLEKEYNIDMRSI